MASLEEIREARLSKLTKLVQEGMNPYPISTKRNYENSEAVEEFDSLLSKELILAGRVMALRPQGGLVFLNFFDGTASFQALLKSDEMSKEDFDRFLNTVDIGDFIEVQGMLFLTKRDEKTLKVKTWRMLSKSLLPLPEKWHGLQDIEERFRKRYLDLLMNKEVRDRFILRGKLVTEIRKFYDDAGFFEVETPILQTLAGGATALPFVTHHNALDTDFNLTIAQELYLKKLLAGGFNKVYEIGKKFRNEGIDTTHNPEFTMLESNEAYANAKSQREFIEKLFKTVIKKILGKSTFSYEGKEVDVAKPFAVKTFYELFKEFTNIKNPETINQIDLLVHAKVLGIKTEKNEAPEKIMDGIYKKAIRPNLIQPTFIVDYPVAFNPFAKRKEEDPSLIDRFQLVIAGLEVVNAFSELNNPIDQKERYEEQDKKKREGEGEISPSDLDYLEAMEHGMPPNGGIGIGIDRLAMLITDAKNIKEVILFPTLKPKNLEAKGKKNEQKFAVVVINKGAQLERWQELNALGHLGAAFGARHGKSLFFQNEIFTKDGKSINLNIQHAIMIKQVSDRKIISKILKEAKENNLDVAEFTREMLVTTNDKKVIEMTRNKDSNEIEHLGVLIFGSKGIVENITKDTELYS